VSKPVETSAPGKSGGATGVARPSHERLLTIGQLVSQLQTEYPDLSITKVRYLEDRGLVTPVRTPGGYRKYGAADVRRLRTVLALQRDEYLPLEVIRERLDRGTASVLGRPVASAAAARGSGPSLRREEPSYTWEEACEATGVDDQFLRMLAEYRLVHRPAQQSGPVLTDSDLEITRICHLLARYGVEPRNLRLLSSSVEREAALLEQVAAPGLRSTHPDRREFGERTLEDLGALLSQLLHLLLFKELRDLL
jgi:hypothetical protein